MLELNYNRFTNKDFTAFLNTWLPFYLQTHAISPNSLFTNLPSIRRYTASATDSVLK